MNKYTIAQQIAISDIIFNYQGDTDEVVNILNALGFTLTYDEVLAEYQRRL